jgi:hypothetical protein
MENPMKKLATLLSLALVFSVLTATSALALTANHPYTVQLHTVSDAGQSMLVEQMNSTSDANGKLHFQFSNVPDTDSAPFLMVQIMDTVNGQLQMVRQTLAPAPTAGEQMQMGVSEISHHQTQAALQAMQSGAGTAALDAMFPLTMISSGAISDADADNLGLMAAAASVEFETYMTQSGVSVAQMTAFRTRLTDAMRTFASDCKLAVDATDPLLAANRYGRADSEFLQAMIAAGADAGIDPELLSAAFDQARVAMENAPGAMTLSSEAYAMLDGTFMAGHQQRQLQAQTRNYADAMEMFHADTGQSQAFTAARTALYEAMLQARQEYQLIFSDPDNLPDQLTIDQAQADHEIAIQAAMDTFLLATEATDLQIETMLGEMANHMDGGMMGGGMMTGSTLAGLGFGMMQTTLTGTPQNWSTMMVAATNFLPSLTGMSYTPDTTNLTNQLAQLSPASMPTAPDLSLLPDGQDKSLLHLQYDLMLVRLIDMQMAANLTPPLTPSDLASISAVNLANRVAVRQGLQGLTEAQQRALMAAMSPMELS